MNALKVVWDVLISDNKYRKEYTTGNKKIHFSLRMPVFIVFFSRSRQSGQGIAQLRIAYK
jgi:hypothetical protein